MFSQYFNISIKLYFKPFEIKFSGSCLTGQVLFNFQFCSPEIVLGLFQKKLSITKPAVLNNVIYFTWRTFSIFPNFVQLGFVGYNFHLGTVQALLVLVMDTNNSNSKIIWTLEELKKILKKIPVNILSYVTVFIEHFILLQKTGSKENLFPTFLFGYCYPNELGWGNQMFLGGSSETSETDGTSFLPDLFCRREPKNHIELVSVYPTFWKQPRSICEEHCILLTLVSCWKSGTI